MAGSKRGETNTMPRQQQWTIYEAAVLLDGVLQYRDNRVSKPEAILSVSNQLRKMAENRGQNIDDVYRNVNGITFQMLSMESALAGYTIIKPATRLFDEIVRIYREEYDRFNQILSEAKVMIYPTSSRAKNPLLQRADYIQVEKEIIHSQRQGCSETDRQDTGIVHGIPACTVYLRLFFFLGCHACGELCLRISGRNQRKD